MCCFSGPVSYVGNTRIFARKLTQDRQAIIYAMAVSSDHDVAMVLPLPVKAGSGEASMKFYNFDRYPTLFEDMEKGFPAPRSPVPAAFAAGPVSRSAPLAVQNVGSFEASFVPTISDFERLDRRFRLPDGTWEKLPGYQKFGFAVFKLKKGASNVHPMAFSFPTSEPGHLFFPTVHIHDGKVHKTAEFDHRLYCQAAGISFPNWIESSQVPLQHMKVGDTHGLVAESEHLHRRWLSGNKTNTDLVLKLPA